MKRVLSIDIGAKKMYNTPKRKGKSGGAMEIQTIQIRHLFCNGFTNNHAEGDCHRKTLPYLSIVQATEGEYAIRLNDGPEAHTGCGGFFAGQSISGFLRLNRPAFFARKEIRRSRMSDGGNFPTAHAPCWQGRRFCWPEPFFCLLWPFILPI